VYATDVKAAAGKVDGVEIPDTGNVIASYPIAVVRNSKNPELARAFMAHAVSDAGRNVLVAHGFRGP
jgi:molybdate transport system substrate-binding protein